MTDEEQKRRGISDEDRKSIEERERNSKSKNYPNNSGESNFWAALTGSDRRNNTGRFGSR
jgi:hypothetical protein